MISKEAEMTNEIEAAETMEKSELEMPIWSVVTFDEVAASGLTYSEAAEKLEKLKAEKFSGLCVVTDEAAERIKAKDKK